MKKLYIIEDWARNRIFPQKEFKSFEEGWEYILEKVDNSEYDESGDINDDNFQEYFVIEKK